MKLKREIFVCRLTLNEIPKSRIILSFLYRRKKSFKIRKTFKNSRPKFKPLNQISDDKLPKCTHRKYLTFDELVI